MNEIAKVELKQKIATLELKHLKVMRKANANSHPATRMKIEAHIKAKQIDLRKLVQKKANLKRPPRTKAWSRRADNKTTKRYCSTDKIIMNFISANQNQVKYVCPRCKVIHIMKVKK